MSKKSEQFFVFSQRAFVVIGILSAAALIYVIGAVAFNAYFDANLHWTSVLRTLLWSLIAALAWLVITMVVGLILETDDTEE